MYRQAHRQDYYSPSHNLGREILINEVEIVRLKSCQHVVSKTQWVQGDPHLQFFDVGHLVTLGVQIIGIESTDSL